MRKKRSVCPIAHVLDIFGDRWTLLIVRDIAIRGARHYKDFQAAGEGIATNILAHRLKQLVAHGVLQSAKDPKNGTRRLYALTKKGLDLLPILIEMILWSAKHDKHSPVPQAFVEKATGHREALLAEMGYAATGQEIPSD